MSAQLWRSDLSEYLLLELEALQKNVVQFSIKYNQLCRLNLTMYSD